MGAKFLSDQFMSEASTVLASHPGFNNAIANVSLGLQFVVTDAPDGDVHYHLAVADGSADMGLGDLDEPDVTVTNTYDTSVAISKGELNTQMAFMTGKLKVAGNMAKLMMHQNVINEFAQALKSMDVDY